MSPISIAGRARDTVPSRRPLDGGFKRDPAGNRAATKELVALGIYFLLVVSLSDVFNLRLGVELMTLVVAIAAVFISRAGRQFLRDWWYFLAGLIIWNLSGPVAAQSSFPAHLNFMLQTDRTLFLGHDPVSLIQLHLADGTHVNALDVITSLAYNLHVPEPYIAGYFLWRLNRLVYLQFSAAALLLLLVGFITFIVFPAVPPWAAAKWYGDVPGVVNRFGLTLRSHPLPFHGTPIFYLFTFKGDAIAAFPSEHAAFPLLELLAFSRCTGRWVVGALSVWVLFVLFTILYLGEHWVTDALAGYLYALVIFTAVLAISGWRRNQVLPGETLAGEVADVST